MLLIASIPVATWVVWAVVGLPAIALLTYTQGDNPELAFAGRLVTSIIVVAIGFYIATWTFDFFVFPGEWSGRYDPYAYGDFDPLGNDPPPKERGCYEPC